MFDGKTFFPETGIPIRKIACMIKLFALAEPVPLTVAILKAKSLMEDITGAFRGSSLEFRGRGLISRNSNLETRNSRVLPRIRNQDIRPPHIPRRGRAPLGAQSAVQADVLVFDH